MEARNILVALPVVIAILLLVSYSTINKPSVQEAVAKFFVVKNDDSCGECSSSILADDCRSTSGPVLGGVDLVNYFVAYQNDDGTYDESETGVAGSVDYSYVYNGYTFYFSSEDNLKIFKSNPVKYVPKWGGFCSWGVAGEYCPKYSWAADCLGPDGSWSTWTIQEGRIFFFKDSSPKEKFLTNTTLYIAAGDKRWNDWFGEDTLKQFNTNCYTD